MATNCLGILICVCLIGLVHSDVFSGPKCAADADCLDNSKCSSNVCKCSTNYALSGDWTRCLQVLLVSYDATNKCEEHCQCTPRLGPGGICSEGMCICKEGFHYLHGVCHKSSGLSDECAAEENCYENYSYESLTCGSDNKCQCADGFYKADGYETCRRNGVNVGDECMFDADCTGTNLYCNTTFHECVDDPSYIPTMTFHAWSVPRGESRVGDSCRNSGKCTPSTKTECFLDSCLCLQGYSNFNNYCTPDLGGPCSDHSECGHINFAECGLDKTCRCKLPYVANVNNRECRLATTYGTECMMDEQCRFLGGGASCQPNDENKLQCLCKAGYHFVESTKLCVLDRELLQICVQDSDCVTANSTCQKSYCRCIAGYREISTTCVPDVQELGDYCLNSDDCDSLVNSECVDNQCSCVTGFLSDDGVTCDAVHTGFFNGPTCDADVDCPENAECSSNVCECETNYVLSGDWTRCLQVQPVPYDATNKCEEHQQCTPRLGPGGICSEGMCVCSEGFHYLHGVCHRSSGFGDKCTEEDHCYESYSYEAIKCGSDNKCECADGFYRVDDTYETCRKKGINVGDECIFNMDCKEGDLYCNTTIYQCVDDPTYTPTTTSNTWFLPIGETQVGDLCWNNYHCTPSSKFECFLGRCLCLQGYSNYNRYCLSDLGESCSDNSECGHIDFAECGLDKTCRCKLPYIANVNNRECRLGMTYGTECKVDEQCMFLGGGASCQPNDENKLQCACKAGYHYVKSIQLCVLDRELSQTCIHYYDCVTANSTCQRSYCKCITDYHENSATCVPDVQKLGDYCLNSDDCDSLANTECVDNQCSCVSGFFEGDDGETCLTGLTGKCSIDADCMMENSICREEKCVCSSGTISSSDNTKCLLVGVYGSECEEDIQCTDHLGARGGSCVNGACGCKHDYHYRRNYCWHISWLVDSSEGPACDITADCPLKAICSNSVCQCLENYVLSGDWTRCLQVQPVPYDSTNKCEEHYQCSTRMGQGGICSEGMCVCTEGFHYLHGVCHRSVGLDETCDSEDDNCYQSYNYEAVKCGSKKTCECADGYYRVNSSETCRMIGEKVGDECFTDMDCKGTDLSCGASIKQCVNDPTYTPNKTTITLSPPTDETQVGTWCNYANPCKTSTKTECFLNQCVCKPGFSNYENYCMPDLGETCSDDSECAHINARNARCGLDKKCRCNMPYVSKVDNRGCTPVRKHGDYCLLDEQCKFLGEGAFCQWIAEKKLKCFCRADYHYVESIALCVLDRGLSETCMNDYECVTANATCQSSYCKCITGYHENNATCVPDIQKLGDYCVNSKDCVSLANSECDDNQCSCVSGFFEGDDGVTCLTGITGTCNVDADCKVNSSTCVNAKCVCSTDTTATTENNKCLPVGTQGSGCEEDIQCMGQLGVEGGICIDGVCGCKERYHYKDNYCWDIRYLGDPCEKHDQCYVKSGLTDRVNCENGFCKCDYQYEQTEDLECRSGVGRDGASAAVTGLLLLIAVLNMRDGWTAGRP